jgi:hypothetical protein
MHWICSALLFCSIGGITLRDVSLIDLGLVSGFERQVIDLLSKHPFCRILRKTNEVACFDDSLTNVYSLQWKKELSNVKVEYAEVMKVVNC